MRSGVVLVKPCGHETYLRTSGLKANTRGGGDSNACRLQDIVTLGEDMPANLRDLDEGRLDAVEDEWHEEAKGY